MFTGELHHNNDITGNNEKNSVYKYPQENTPLNQYILPNERVKQGIVENNTILNAEIILHKGDD